MTEFLVDTKTDAKRILRSEIEVCEYLASFGLAASDAIWDRRREDRVSVIIPSWADEQAENDRLKAAACARWGCE